MKMQWVNLISRCNKKLLPSTCEKQVKNEKDENRGVWYLRFSHGSPADFN
jgi:hypothetical protein